MAGKTSGKPGRDRNCDQSSKHKPPVSIPLDFEAAVEGLLAVDPRKPAQPEKPKPRAKKKPDQK